MPGFGSWSCLSEQMADHGHTLEPICSRCAGACLYAAPCGCGSATCIDRTIGAGRSGLAAAA